MANNNEQSTFSPGWMTQTPPQGKPSFSSPDFTQNIEPEVDKYVSTYMPSLEKENIEVPTRKGFLTGGLNLASDDNQDLFPSVDDIAKPEDEEELPADYMNRGISEQMELSQNKNYNKISKAIENSVGINLDEALDKYDVSDEQAKKLRFINDQKRQLFQELYKQGKASIRDTKAQEKFDETNKMLDIQLQEDLEETKQKQAEEEIHRTEEARKEAMETMQRLDEVAYKSIAEEDSDIEKKLTDISTRQNAGNAKEVFNTLENLIENSETGINEEELEKYNWTKGYLAGIEAKGGPKYSFDELKEKNRQKHLGFEKKVKTGEIETTDLSNYLSGTVKKSSGSTPFDTTSEPVDKKDLAFYASFFDDNNLNTIEKANQVAEDIKKLDKAKNDYNSFESWLGNFGETAAFTAVDFSLINEAYERIAKGEGDEEDAKVMQDIMDKYYGNNPEGLAAMSSYLSGMTVGCAASGVIDNATLAMIIMGAGLVAAPFTMGSSIGGAATLSATVLGSGFVAGGIKGARNAAKVAEGMKEASKFSKFRKSTDAFLKEGSATYRLGSDVRNFGTLKSTLSKTELINRYAVDAFELANTIGKADAEARLEVGGVILDQKEKDFVGIRDAQGNLIKDSQGNVVTRKLTEEEKVRKAEQLAKECSDVYKGNMVGILISNMINLNKYIRVNPKVDNFLNQAGKKYSDFIFDESGNLTKFTGRQFAKTAKKVGADVVEYSLDNSVEGLQEIVQSMISGKNTADLDNYIQGHDIEGAGYFFNSIGRSFLENETMASDFFGGFLGQAAGTPFLIGARHATNYIGRKFSKDDSQRTMADKQAGSVADVIDNVAMRLRYASNKKGFEDYVSEKAKNRAEYEKNLDHEVELINNYMNNNSSQEASINAFLKMMDAEKKQNLSLEQIKDGTASKEIIEQYNRYKEESEKQFIKTLLHTGKMEEYKEFLGKQASALEEKDDEFSKNTARQMRDQVTKFSKVQKAIEAIDDTFNPYSGRYVNEYKAAVFREGLFELALDQDKIESRTTALKDIVDRVNTIPTLDSGGKSTINSLLTEESIDSAVQTLIQEIQHLSSLEDVDPVEKRRILAEKEKRFEGFMKVKKGFLSGKLTKEDFKNILINDLGVNLGKNDAYSVYQLVEDFFVNQKDIHSLKQRDDILRNQIYDKEELAKIEQEKEDYDKNRKLFIKRSIDRFRKVSATRSGIAELQKKGYFVSEKVLNRILDGEFDPNQDELIVYKKEGKEVKRLTEKDAKDYNKVIDTLEMYVHGLKKYIVDEKEKSAVEAKTIITSTENIIPLYQLMDKYGLRYGGMKASELIQRLKEHGKGNIGILVKVFGNLINKDTVVQFSTSLGVPYEIKDGVLTIDLRYCASDYMATQHMDFSALLFHALLAKDLKDSLTHNKTAYSFFDKLFNTLKGSKSIEGLSLSDFVLKVLSEPMFFEKIADESGNKMKNLIKKMGGSISKNPTFIEAFNTMMNKYHEVGKGTIPTISIPTATEKQLAKHNPTEIQLFLMHKFGKNAHKADQNKVLEKIKSISKDACIFTRLSTPWAKDVPSEDIRIIAALGLSQQEYEEYVRAGQRDKQGRLLYNASQIIEIAEAQETTEQKLEIITSAFSSYVTEKMSLDELRLLHKKILEYEEQIVKETETNKPVSEKLQEEVIDDIEASRSVAKFTEPNPAEKNFNLERKEGKDIIKILEEGKTIEIGVDTIFSMKKNNTFTVEELKNRFGLSESNALKVIEQFTPKGPDDKCHANCI